MFVVKQETPNKPKFIIKATTKAQPITTTNTASITTAKTILPQSHSVILPTDSTLITSTLSSPNDLQRTLYNPNPNSNSTLNPTPVLIPFKNKKIRFRLSVVKDPISDRKNKRSKEHKNKVRKQTKDDKFSNGRWKVDEHQRFVEAIIKFGNDWKQVQKYVRTRSSTQARSHAQKFFVKIKKAKILKFNLDLSKNSIKMLHDLLNELSNEEYKRIIHQLNTVAFERNNIPKKKNTNNSYSDESMSDSSSMEDKNDEGDDEDINISDNLGIMDNMDNNRPDIKYILNGFINSISNEELYGPDQQLNTNMNLNMNMNMTYPMANGSNMPFDFNNPRNMRGMSFDIDEVYLRQKRASINSMEGFFKNCIDDKDIKNLNFNMGSEKPMHLIDFNDKNFISNTNMRKVSNDEELLLSYLKSNINKV